MKKTIWKIKLETRTKKELTGDIKTNVAIVGGGIAGVLISYVLSTRGIKSVILEKDEIGMGITRGTTAKVSAQHNLIYDKLLKQVGLKKAKMYLEANLDAVSEYEKIAENFDFDFERKNSYVYTLENDEKIRNEINSLKKLGYKAKYVTKTELPFKILSAVSFENQGQMNPLKLIGALANHLDIYENTKVESIENNLIKTNKGAVTANHIVIATHFPFINNKGFYFMKMHQYRSYVVAVNGGRDLYGIYIDENEKGYSFRNYGDLTLVGGQGHRTGKKKDNNHFGRLENMAKKCYKNSELAEKWATQDCVTIDGIPYIGEYSSNSKNLYVATGFNKWGMTSAMISAKIISDKIEGKENKYAEVFSPTRFNAKASAKQLAVNGFETMTNYIGFPKKRCTHLGCALIFNKEEQSYDCPCHGSRFSCHGEILNNPAIKKL